MELVKTLKKKFQKTVYRKINTGMRIEYDEEKGIINEETKEVIISLDKIIKEDDEDEDDNADDKGDENDIDDDKNEEEEDKKEKINGNEKNEEKNENINGKECEDIDTSSKPEE